jgi:flagellar protein FlaG
MEERVMEMERISSSRSITPTVHTSSEFKSNKNQDLNQQRQGRKKEEPVSKEKLEEKINGLNEFLVPAHTSLNFKLHDKLDEYYVQIIDDKTKEVIKEIPSSKFLDMYATMAEFVGIIVDKKV